MIIIICLHTVIWFQAFISNTNNVHIYYAHLWTGTLAWDHSIVSVCSVNDQRVTLLLYLCIGSVCIGTLHFVLVITPDQGARCNVSCKLEGYHFIPDDERTKQTHINSLVPIFINILIILTSHLSEFPNYIFHIKEEKKMKPQSGAWGV